MLSLLTGMDVAEMELAADTDRDTDRYELASDPVLDTAEWGIPPLATINSTKP